MSSTIDQAMRLLSPLLGTALYVLAGPDAVIALTVVFFLIAAVILVGLRLEESEPEDPANRGGLWAEVSAGFRYLRHTPPLGRLTLLLGVGIAATGLVNIAIFPFLDQGVGVAASTIGVLVSIQGVGAILGGLTAAWAIGRSGEVPTFALGMAGLGIGLVPLMANSLTAAVAGMALGGFSVSWLVVSYATARQRLTPARLQGRVAGAANISINLPQAVITFVGAGLLAVADYRLLVLATVIVVFASALAATPARHAGPPTLPTS